MPKPAVAPLPTSFEGAVAELEALVEKMESGDLPLEAALAGYARGTELLKYAQSQLDAAQARLKVLDGEVLKTLSLGDAEA
jgi:exodeoxyribonuclease VII small subunit